jgi:hypothetical protein
MARGSYVKTILAVQVRGMVVNSNFRMREKHTATWRVRKQYLCSSNLSNHGAAREFGASEGLLQSREPPVGPGGCQPVWRSRRSLLRAKSCSPEISFCEVFLFIKPLSEKKISRLKHYRFQCYFVWAVLEGSEVLLTLLLPLQ